MTEHWVDVTAAGATARYPLKTGLTRLGGRDADVEVPGAVDELHIWSDPPKVIHVGAGSVPLLAGRAFEEATLADGDTLQWGSAILVYGRVGQAVIREVLPEAEEYTAPAPKTGPAPSQVPSGAPDTRFEQRLRAGVLADLGLADRKEVKRWQEAVIRGEFDADACARDLATTDAPASEDRRVLERAARLQRDLLMMPIQRGTRGTGRRARMATRKGMAYVVANVIAITVYSLVLVAIMVLVRINYDFSFDRVIDQFMDIFR